MPKKILSHLFKSESPVMFRPSMDPVLWRWIRKWVSECDLQRFQLNKSRMQRVAVYSRDVLRALRDQHVFDYEQTTGVLRLLRTARDVQQAQSTIDMLVANNLPHRVVDIDAARLIEPALAVHTPFAGALYLPQDEAGNCPLFTRQLKAVVQTLGVEFHFNSTVQSIVPEGDRVSLHIDGRVFAADAVVIAAGMESAHLLEPLGIELPLYPVKGFSATALIKNYDEAPLAAVVDESFDAAITRMGSRIRISGTAELGSRTLELRDAALRTLVKVGEDWFPDAANYNTATFWCGARPMLPDGPPLLGPTAVKNVFLNVGHGSSGWAMAAGSGKILADVISKQEPDIDLDGLTLARYG